MQIDFSKRDKTPFFKARLVWQELFNEYRDNGGNLDEMGDMLCDLKRMEELLRKPEVHFYWGFSESGFTEITIDYLPEYEKAYQIYSVDNKIDIEKVQQQAFPSPNLRSKQP